MPALSAPISSRIRAATACALLAGSISCRSTPAPGKDPPPAPSSTASAAGAAMSGEADRPAAPKGIPSLTAENFAVGGFSPRSLHPIEGGIAVLGPKGVGRIAGDDIEWSPGKIPEGSEALGANIINGVGGRWPDALDVTYSSSNGRAPAPTYFPLTGKGTAHTFAPGGGAGWVTGVVRVGDSTILAGNDYQGPEFMSVRGPSLVRTPLTPEEAGCKPDEVRGQDASVAIAPVVVAGTSEGTLVSIGRFCGGRGMAAEVWGKTGKSRIVDLAWVKSVSFRTSALRGSGDEFFLHTDPFRPILHYQNGKFEPLPRLESPTKIAFVSPTGQLHASDGRTIHRFEEGKWIPVARLPASPEIESLAFDKETIFAVAGAKTYRLRPDPSAEQAAPEEGCKTPFVYLYDVNPKNAKNFTFPATGKALSSFAGAGEIGFVEFNDGDRRRLGVTVPSTAQRDALIAHLRETMKDEDPRAYCYEPKAPRKIPLGRK